MSEEIAIRSLHAQLGRFRSSLTPVADRLAQVLADLADAPDPETAWRRLRRLVLESLPPEDRVTGLFAGAGAAPTRDPRSENVVEEIDWGRVRATARLLLSSLDDRGPGTDEIIELAKTRLRAAPARTAFRPDRDLIVLDHPDGRDAAPDFQFAADGTLRPVVRTVNRMLGVARSPWTAASWWLSRNSAAGGVPAELLGDVPDERLIALARAGLVES